MPKTIISAAVDTDARENEQTIICAHSAKKSANIVVGMSSKFERSMTSPGVQPMTAATASDAARARPDLLLPSIKASTTMVPDISNVASKIGSGSSGGIPAGESAQTM